MGWPVVVKLDALDLAHKSDVGAVALGLEERGVQTLSGRSSGRVRAGATIRGVLVQAMVVGGTEVIVGARRDPQFGVVVLSDWAACSPRCSTTSSSGWHR
jgi:acetyltransferase